MKDLPVPTVKSSWVCEIICPHVRRGCLISSQPPSIMSCKSPNGIADSESHKSDARKLQIEWLAMRCGRPNAHLARSLLFHICWTDTSATPHHITWVASKGWPRPRTRNSCTRALLLTEGALLFPSASGSRRNYRSLRALLVPCGACCKGINQTRHRVTP